MKIKSNGLNLDVIDCTFHLQLSKFRLGREVQMKSQRQSTQPWHRGQLEATPRARPKNCSCQWMFLQVLKQLGPLFYWGRVTAVPHPQKTRVSAVPLEHALTTPLHAKGPGPAFHLLPKPVHTVSAQPSAVFPQLQGKPASALLHVTSSGRHLGTQKSQRIHSSTTCASTKNLAVWRLLDFYFSRDKKVYFSPDF